MAQQQMQKTRTTPKRHNEAIQDYESQRHQDTMRSARRASRRARRVRTEAEAFLNRTA